MADVPTELYQRKLFQCQSGMHCDSQIFLGRYASVRLKKTLLVPDSRLQCFSQNYLGVFV